MKINQVNMGVQNVQNPSKEAISHSHDAVVFEKGSMEQLPGVANQVRVEGSRETQSEVEPLNEAMLERSIEQANKALEVHNRHIAREVHDVTKTVIYTLKDNETGEVIQEFPPRKIQDMIAKMWELAGLFVDERA